MKSYYKKRAKEYEEIYYRQDSQRQMEQREIAAALKKAMAGRNVLEVACGTGYWTVFASETAGKITATDALKDVLEIAGQKAYDSTIEFKIEDAYKLSFLDNTFTGGIANFWFSHIPKQKLMAFLKEFHRVLKLGSSVFIADNVYKPGVGGELVRKSGNQNTYKLRKLKDGSETLVLKNYYTINELMEIFQQYGTPDVFYGRCFWHVSYQLERK